MLTGVHFILTYNCNYECDHCFLYCSSKTIGTFTFDQVRQVLTDLKKIKTVETICFEGGEPFLYYPLLVESIKFANSLSFNTAIETNSYWATTEEDAQLWLAPLQEAGLTVLEVSDDQYHHGEQEITPAKRATAAADKLGIPIRSMCIEKPSIKEDSSQGKGEPVYSGGPRLKGRAFDKMTNGLPTKPWNEFTECPFEDLRNPSRVHVDPFGNVHLCQGISMGNLWETPLSQLIKNYDPETHPISGPMLRGGPAGLAEERDIPHDDEYIHACHFCTSMCRALIDEFPTYITPRQVYGLDIN